jgi:uncharacterized protein (TIGR00645 family)
MYAGLAAALIAYTLKFMEGVFNLFGFPVHFVHLNKEEIMLAVISLVDQVMIGNLVIMILIGSYSIFVKRLQILPKDAPKWLDSITSGTLKIKMGMSLVGVSSIHLLKDFVEPDVSWPVIWKHLFIHCVFLLSTLALAHTDKTIHETSHT